MQFIQTLALRNVAYLEQGLELIGRLGPQRYASRPSVSSRGGVGGHVRHILDHYTSFFEGVKSGRVDYDRRERRTELEESDRAAKTGIQDCIHALRSFAAEDGRLEVAMDCGEEGEGAREWSGSTVSRELRFLVSHTVHHYATIRLILVSEGFDPGEDFGVAPSTLRFERGELSCAP